MSKSASNPGKSVGLRSMTGYAPISGNLGEWSFAGDVKSVNGRGLDLRIRVPDWVTGLEPALRKALQAKLARGSVTLSLRVTRESASAALTLDTKQLNAAIVALREIENAADTHGLAVTPSTAAEIAGIRGVLDLREADNEDTAPLSAAILAAAETAIDAFNVDRDREGAALQSVIEEQLSRVETLVASAAQAAGDRTASARAALDRNLARLLDATEVPDEARLLQELALVAVKTDVTEELDRLTAHVAAARGLLGEAGPTGRKLDFLMQEFNREANTLCSKAQSTELTAIGLDLKAVIDQMREQVQNVE